MTQKQVTIKLFYNLSDRTFYTQIGEVLIRTSDKLITAIQEKEGLDIRHAADMKAMQLLSLEDEKLKGNE